MHLLAPGTGRVDAAGGVTGQKPPLDGTLQGGVEGDVVVSDGPGAEAALPVPSAAGQFLTVVGLEVLRSELRQGDGTQSGDP